MTQALSSAAGWLGPGGHSHATVRALGVVSTIARLLAEDAAQPDATPLGIACRAQRTASTILAKHGIEVRRSGQVPAGPALLVANHVSYLDPLVVAHAVPCVAIAKGEAMQWPLIGRGLRALGVIFVRRGHPHSGAVALRRAWRTLRGGAPIINFPEGTTSDGKGVEAFQSGSFGLARLAGVPVVPLFLSYDHDCVPWYGGRTFLPHYWEVSRLPSLIARVTFGEPLYPDGSAGAPDFARRAHAAVIALRTGA